MKRVQILLVFVLVPVFLSTVACKRKSVSVPDDFPTIEAAYANVQTGGTITIKPGKYELSDTIDVNRTVTFLGDSEDMDDVVIDCPEADAFHITGGNPSFKNLSVSSKKEEGEAFYVFRGAPQFIHCTITSRMGNGMIVLGEDCNPYLESCVIKNCGKQGLEFSTSARGTVQNCEFYGNIGAGIWVMSSSDPTFIGCKIHDGKEVGLVVGYGSFGEFKDCQIYGNASGGINVMDSGTNPTFIECKIHDNESYGVFIVDNALGEFKDCEIYKNTGTGIDVMTGNPTVTGCKIYDGKEAGVRVFDRGKGTFNNNTLKNNGKNWVIRDDAGVVKGSGNNPEIPEQ
ncbi:MAG: right-handed parallel beta-helix repeat-containing protein [Thermoguttaceae bacterium]|nr:right-handed parallel beta-helix repeat-containing protein [Thermoguttaceae bacterium]